MLKLKSCYLKNLMNKTFEQLQREDDDIIRRRGQIWPPSYSSGFSAETLAQALADATAVRQTALANARAALDAAFANKPTEVSENLITIFKWRNTYDR